MDTIAGDVIEIGTQGQWEIFYRPLKNDFLARKGRKERTGNYRDGLLTEIANEDKAEARKNARLDPAPFRLWDDEKQAERRVEITSYSARGLGVRPVGGGEVFYLKLAGYGAWGADREKQAVRMIPDKVDAARLHRAVEMLRRAQEEMRQAYRDTVVEIKVNWTTGHNVDEFFREEDRIRAAINQENR